MRTLEVCPGQSVDMALLDCSTARLLDCSDCSTARLLDCSDCWTARLLDLDCSTARLLGLLGLLGLLDCSTAQLHCSIVHAHGFTAE
jgi:hypothetical protein